MAFEEPIGNPLDTSNYSSTDNYFTRATVTPSEGSHAGLSGADGQPLFGVNRFGLPGDSTLSPDVQAPADTSQWGQGRHLSLVPNDFDGLFETIEDQWQDRALCAQTDPEAFFPEKGGSTREAKRICQGCEVKAECLEYALHNDERFGIWGGLSERERRRLKRGII